MLRLYDCLKCSVHVHVDTAWSFLGSVQPHHNYFEKTIRLHMGQYLNTMRDQPRPLSLDSKALNATEVALLQCYPTLKVGRWQVQSSGVSSPSRGLADYGH